jgi:endonuclease YncB( thermonuclease family)
MSFRRKRSPLPPTITMSNRWRKHWPTTLVLTLIAFAVVCDRADRFQTSRQSPTASTGTDRPRYHDKTFRVVKVVDGDTLDIDIPDTDRATTRIRLWGVDTPEVQGSPAGEMYFGPEASKFAKETLSGTNVRIVLAPNKTRGKYGRLLAYVMLERSDEMFNELLLQKGLAYADRRFPHAYREQFQAIEKRARRNGAGLWANVTIDQMPKWRQRFEKKP